MNKKMLIVSLIIILMLGLLIIVVSIVKYNASTSEDMNETNEVNQDNVNGKSENTDFNTNSDSDNIGVLNITGNNDSDIKNINEENDEYIFYHEDETGTAEYTRNQLDNFELNVNISNEVLQYITDYDDFYTTIKEYVYQKGLVDANTAEMEKYQLDQTNNRVGVVFQLNNDDEDKFLAIFYLNTGATEVYNY